MLHKDDHPAHLESHQEGICDFLNDNQESRLPVNTRYQQREQQHRPSPQKKSAPAAFEKESKEPISGAKKRNLMSSLDRKDKTMQLEIENNGLKEKENLLNREIVSMHTKLRRIEALIQQRSKYGNGDTLDIIDIQNDLQNECDALKNQNDAAKEKIRKLTVIQRGLAVKPAGAPTKTDKYAHVQGKLESLHTPAMKRFAAEADDMRAQIVINNRKKMEMEHQLEVLKKQNKGILGPNDAKRMRNEIQDMMVEQRHLEAEMIMLTADQKSREAMFKDSKAFVTEIQQKIRDTTTENEKLKQENFRLQIKTQQVTDFEAELKMIEKERDDIERSIKSIMAEPFLRKNNEKPIHLRIEDLQMKLVEIEKHQKKTAIRKKELEEEISKKKAAFQKLNYEKEYLSVDFNKAKDDFKQIHGNKAPTEHDAVQGLIQMDTGKYTNMMTDLVMGEAPSWAKLDFLDREKNREEGPKGIREEIEFLTQEKADLAGELEKAQNLLRLQSDIQRENDEYYKRELERLKLVSTSAKTKQEELARRADEKQRLINELYVKNQKEEAKIASPMKTHKAGAENLDQLEVQSEFSVASNETEIHLDENILDFKIEDAEYHFANFNQIETINHLKGADGKQFVTLLTVDFFNCPSETTGLAEGFTPNYNTQISFKNKVDKFYLSNFERGTIKIDCYVSIKDAAVHIGRCEVILRELIQSELAVTDLNVKTPLISGWARLYPVVPDGLDNQGMILSQGKPIGIVKYKMRLRRPIQEAWRYNRERNEIDNMTRALAINPTTGPLKPQKKIVTISVICCEKLQISYAGIRDVAPFFFYQFFTFDDRYSKNGFGVSPKWDDTFSYEVVFDAKAQNYFEKEFLEIIIFDDMAPITGQSLEKQTNATDDMVGIAKIPLKSVAQSVSMHDKFVIHAPKTNTVVGYIEVKLSVMDIDAIGVQTLKTSNVKQLHFNKEWEEDIIMRIAGKLAGLQCEVELLFGIFSSGQRTCTKEDFAYCCLTRLQLEKQITAREMDLFLEGNEQLKDKSYIEREDFVAVFSNAVIRARSEQQNQLAKNITMGKYQSQTSLGGLERSYSASMMDNYHTQELLEIMGSIVKLGLQYDILKAVGYQQEVSTYQLKKALQDKGMLTDMDAGKVIALLQTNSKVDLKKLDQCFQDAKLFELGRSEAVRKVKEAVQTHIKLCVKYIEAVDFNKDGHLNVDGFIAALLRPEFRLTKEDLIEAFHLITKHQNELAYQEWLEQISNESTKFFSATIHTVSKDKLTDSITLTGREIKDTNTSHDTYNKYDVKESKVQSACIKFENYIRSQDLSLGVMFAIMDSDSDKNLKFSEFRSKLHQIDMRLDEEEIISLFKSLDVNGNGTINYEELINKFSALNNQQLLKRISKFIMSGKGNPDFIFDKYSKDVTRGRMSMGDFAVMVKEFVKRVTQQEILSMFKHFDRGSKSYITRPDFTAAFSSDIKEQTFQIQIEDIIKPLATKLARFKVNIGQMFEKADKDSNYQISAEEFAVAISDTSGGKIKLDESEIKMIKDYFYNRYHHVQINRAEFQELLSTKFQNKFDEAEAKKSLVAIKNKCDAMKIMLQKHMMDHNTDQAEKINLRSFKIALNKLNCLTLYNIDNLTKYMDTENEGFISLNNFTASVNNANTLGDSFKKTMTSSKKSELGKSDSLRNTQSMRTTKWSNTRH